jgi:hypothetical protein
MHGHQINITIVNNGSQHTPLVINFPQALVPCQIMHMTTTLKLTTLDAIIAHLRVAGVDVNATTYLVTERYVS